MKKRKIKTYFIYYILFVLLMSTYKEALLVELSDFRKYQTTKSETKLTKVTKGINYGWGMTFVDDHILLVTEKSGNILKVNIKNGEILNIKHNLNDSVTNENPFANGQGGLLDILYHEGFVYVTYSQVVKKQIGNYRTQLIGSTAIARGKLLENGIIDFQDIFVSSPPLKINKHWGARIIIKDEYLYASLGDRGYGMIAQDPTKHPGSIIRIKLDGLPPSDNPKQKKYIEWLPEIYHIGFRNPQGLAISPNNKEIFFSQHGPRGGDNLGKVIYGGNQGWKNIAWGGSEYYGTKIGKTPFDDKFDKPIISWVPSIGVGQINFYKGKTFNDWTGDIIGTATKYGLLFRLDFGGNQIINKEIIIKERIGRIRDFEIHHTGDIYIIVDEKDAPLWKLSK